MGTLYGCLHRTLEDKTVGSVNADIGAEACSVGQGHLILSLAMAESNLPTTGEELEVKNEFAATGEKKQQKKTSLW